MFEIAHACCLMFMDVISAMFPGNYFAQSSAISLADMYIFFDSFDVSLPTILCTTSPKN